MASDRFLLLEQFRSTSEVKDNVYRESVPNVDNDRVRYANWYQGLGQYQYDDKGEKEMGFHFTKAVRGKPFTGRDGNGDVFTGVVSSLFFGVNQDGKPGYIGAFVQVKNGSYKCVVDLPEETEQ